MEDTILKHCLDFGVHYSQVTWDEFLKIKTCDPLRNRSLYYLIQGYKPLLCC